MGFLNREEIGTETDTIKGSDVNSEILHSRISSGVAGRRWGQEEGEELQEKAEGSEVPGRQEIGMTGTRNRSNPSCTHTLGSFKKAKKPRPQPRRRSSNLIQLVWRADGTQDRAITSTSIHHAVLSVTHKDPTSIQEDGFPQQRQVYVQNSERAEGSLPPPLPLLHARRTNVYDGLASTSSLSSKSFTVFLKISCPPCSFIHLAGIFSCTSHRLHSVEETAVNKTDKNICSHGAYILEIQPPCSGRDDPTLDS